jgi:hypothetical protein
VPGIGDGMFLDALPADAVDSIVATAVPPLLSVEIRQLGGKLAEPSVANGAVGSIEAEFAVFAVGIAPTPEAASAVHAAVDRTRAALTDWESHRTYFNFAERNVPAERLYPAETYRRLRRMRAAHDPGEMFVANHRI